MKLGATWLHPAARAEKHLRERDEEDAQISAFRVPKTLDRSKVRDALASKLITLGLYNSDQSERLEQYPADREGVFADGIIKDLGLT